MCREKVFSLLAVFLTLSTVAFADNNISKKDGNDWNGLPDKETKIFFIAGFMAGADNAAENLTGRSWYFLPRPNCEKSQTKKINDKWSKTINKESSGKGLNVDEMKYVYWCLADQEGEANRYKIPNITVGQMVDGLDALYSDFKNRSIFISDAVYFVRNQIGGLPSDDAEKLLLYLRGGKTDVEQLIVHDADGKFVRSISFP